MVEYKHKIYEYMDKEYIGCIGHYCSLGETKLDDLLKDSPKETSH